MSAVARRLERRLAHLQMTHRILDVDDRIIDQQDEHQRQAAQGHDVERLAEVIEPDEGGHHRQWNGQGHDPRAADAAQEKQHHERGQHGAEDALRPEIGHGVRILVIEGDHSSL